MATPDPTYPHIVDKFRVQARAALVAAAELTGEVAGPGHDDSCRRGRAEQAAEEEPAQPRPPFLLSQSRVNESESDPENSEGNNVGHVSTICGHSPEELEEAQRSNRETRGPYKPRTNTKQPPPSTQ